MAVIRWNEKSGAKRVDTASDLASLPKVGGTLAVVMDTDSLYVFDSDSQEWVLPITASGGADTVAISGYIDDEIAAASGGLEADYAAADTALAGTLLALSGGTLTGPLTLAADPTEDLEAATKQYADSLTVSGEYVSLSGDETVSGVKTFADGLEVSYSGGLFNQIKVANGEYQDAILPRVRGMLDYAGTFYDEYAIARPTANVTTPKRACFNPSDSLIYMNGVSAVKTFSPYTHAELATANITASGDGIAYCPVKGRVWVTAGGNTIVVYSYAEGVVATVAAVSGAKDACWSPTDEQMYVTGSTEDVVYYINPANNTVGGNIACSGETPHAIVFIPTNNTLMISEVDSPALGIIDVASRAYTSQIAVSGAVVDLAFCPSNGLVYAPDSAVSGVHVVNPVTEAIVDFISTGSDPVSVEYHPGIDRIFVGDGTADAVAVINPHTNEVVTTVSGFQDNLQGIVYCPVTHLVYTCSQTSGKIQAIGAI